MHDRSSRTASGTADAPRSKPISFNVGDAVVHVNNGAATVIKKTKGEFKGEPTDIYVLEVVTNGMRVEMPAATAQEKLRPIISKTVARQVLATIKEEPQGAGSNWARWYKLLTEKVNSGDIFQVAEVVRDLTHTQHTKGISPALKRMLANARVILVSELRFALGLSEEDAIKRLDKALPKAKAPAGA